MARILLMDDEDALRAIMVEVLTEEGHEVIDSASGEIALRTGIIDGVDMVITDIIMPEVEGMEAIRARLVARRRGGVVGVNLGANKDAEDRAADYGTVLRHLAPWVEFATVASKSFSLKLSRFCPSVH